MWDNWIEEGAPVTACGIAGALTGAVDGAVVHAGPELTFHLSALGAISGVAIGSAVAWSADQIGRYRLGRRLLRDGPLLAMTILPLAFMAYAYKRGLALDALEPRLFLLPALFLVAARTLNAAFGWAMASKGRPGSRLVVVCWAGLATAFALTVHGLATRPELVVRAVQESQLGGSMLAAIRRSPLLDGDGDGYPVALCAAECDCDDGDPGVNPGAVETAGDGVDQDCSGADLPSAPKPAPRPVTVAEVIGPPEVAPTEPVELAGLFGPPVLEVTSRTRSPEKQDADGRRPDLLLITVDTLRADHLGCYGYKRNTSPFMDELAESGTLFYQARAQGSMTAWSMSSMVTGRYFTELNRTDSKWPRIRGPGPHLGERLKAAGYRTVGVAPQFFFYKRYGLSRGFEVWDTSVVRTRRPFHRHVTGDLLTELAVEQLNELPDDRPVLMWVHYGDPHSDYLFHPGISTFGKSRKGLYDGEIRFTDVQIETLVNAWRGLDRGRPLVGVVTSDHGENLNRKEDHGALYHGNNLYDTLIRVPLIVWGDGVQARIVNEPTGLVDVLPTLMELAGIAADATLPGRSLVPWLRGGTLPSRPLFSEKPRPAHRALKSMVDWPYKLIWHQALNQYSVFDVESDPAESTDLFGGDPARDTALVETMVRWRTLDLQSVPPKG